VTAPDDLYFAPRLEVPYRVEASVTEVACPSEPASVVTGPEVPVLPRYRRGLFDRKALSLERCPSIPLDDAFEGTADGCGRTGLLPRAGMQEPSPWHFGFDGGEPSLLCRPAGAPPTWRIVYDSLGWLVVTYIVRDGRRRPLLHVSAYGLNESGYVLVGEGSRRIGRREWKRWENLWESGWRLSADPVTEQLIFDGVSLAWEATDGAVYRATVTSQSAFSPELGSIDVLAHQLETLWKFDPLQLALPSSPEQSPREPEPPRATPR
jgi:hypothetical protein